MSEEEIILKQEAGVKSYDSESPPIVGLKAGAFADVGTLILTNRRLVYISKGGTARAVAWLASPLAAAALEKKVSKAQIDDFMKYEGSYCIPLNQITEVKSARKLGSAYLSVKHPNYKEKPAHSYILGSGWSKNEDWVAAIDSAIRALANSSLTYSTASLFCSQCGQTLKEEDKFCKNCGAKVMSGPKPRCPKCGGEVSPNDRFCCNCGNALKSS